MFPVWQADDAVLLADDVIIAQQSLDDGENSRIGRRAEEIIVVSQQQSHQVIFIYFSKALFTADLLHLHLVNFIELLPNGLQFGVRKHSRDYSVA